MWGGKCFSKASPLPRRALSGGQCGEPELGTDVVRQPRDCEGRRGRCRIYAKLMVARVAKASERVHRVVFGDAVHPTLHEKCGVRP